MRHDAATSERNSVLEVPSSPLKCQPPAPQALLLITAVGVATCSHNSGGLLRAEPVLMASLSCSCSCARRRCPRPCRLLRIYPPALAMIARPPPPQRAQQTCIRTTTHPLRCWLLHTWLYLALYPPTARLGSHPGREPVSRSTNCIEIAGISAQRPNQRSRGCRDVVSTPRGVTLPSHASA